MYIVSNEACAGIPAQFLHDVMSDDAFINASNEMRIDGSTLGTNDGGNDVLHEINKIGVANFKPRAQTSLTSVCVGGRVEYLGSCQFNACVKD